MFKGRSRLLLASGAMTASLAAAVAPAHATLISIGLQEAGTNGGAITTEATDGGTGSAGVLSALYGTFTLNNISAVGAPGLPQPNLDTNSINVSSASGGTLTVYVTEQGLSSPLGVNNFLSSFTSNIFNGAVTSVTEETLISTSNALYAGSLLASDTFTGLGTLPVTSATPLLSSPYSETTEYIVTTTGSADVNDTIDIAYTPTAVPEPASLGLLGIGLVGLGVLRRRRRG